MSQHSIWQACNLLAISTIGVAATTLTMAMVSGHLQNPHVPSSAGSLHWHFDKASSAYDV